MQAIASELSARLNTPVEVGGVEANMAVAGALTTHGCAVPLAILDLGAGSTDAAIINNDAQYGVVAGQGNIRGTEGPRNAVATGLVLAGEAKK
ncbi:glycerol dehydratase reactivation factor large subunit [Salmonella enterica subsp. enterica serovar Bovismorbificans str. 3114]|nr:glycerol dehydratase reactivation factor large subunit [Salmonella enterica subsp. enterica serovar Bovismorbificans str. 3114]